MAEGLLRHDGKGSFEVSNNQSDSTLKNSPALREFLIENFDRFQLADLALLRLKNETVAETEEDLRRLISKTGTDERERVRLERLLSHLQRNNDAEPLELAKYSRQRRTGAGSEQLVEKE